MKSIALLPLLLTGLLACTAPNDRIDPLTPPTEPSADNLTGTPTAVGQPMGASSTQTIGPAGGSLTTADGKLTLTFPAGALAKETAITVQPIENNAFGGVGPGYRLLPTDVTYQKPATATWNYTDADLNGSTPDALGMASQHSNGSWTGRALTPNKVKKQAIASLSRPQDFAFFEQFFLRPQHPQVLPNETILIKAYYLKNFSGKPEEKDVALNEPVETGLATDWAINGVPVPNHTNTELGLAMEHNDSRMLEYIAPPRSPGSTIAISTRIMIAERTQLQLVTNLSIYGGNTCSVNGQSVNNAYVSLANANGTLGGLISEKGVIMSGAKSVAFAIENFSGKGTYTVNQSTKNPGRSIGMTAYDGQKSYVHFYHTDDNQWVSGGGSVTITEYIPGKLIAGSVSGTLYYTQGGKKEFKSISSSASFRTWIN